MESLLLSVISQYLKDYVNNFTREQVSLNFLRGQGVIKNLDINVDAINEAVFQSDAPALKFTRIIVNTLSIEAPIMNLKNKPITVFIDRLFVEIAEVSEIIKRPPRKPVKKAASARYGFLDRVLDSLSVEVNRITVAFLTLGRMKSNSCGPWTPPVLLLEFSGARIFCTNHNGAETELNECLRVRPTKRPMLFAYKKFEVEKACVHLINPELWFSIADKLLREMSAANIHKLKLDGKGRGFVSLQIVSDIPLKINMCMRKRMDNNLLLGLEIAIVIDVIKINIRRQHLSELLHFAAGLYYCLFRLDVIEEIYGPDPHNEGFVSTSRSPSGARSAMTPQSRKISRDHLGAAEKESIDRFEAEMISTVSAFAVEEDERGDEWHRSSLNSDEDPPHVRSVIVIQVNEASVCFYLDNPTDDVKSVRSGTGSGSGVGLGPGPGIFSPDKNRIYSSPSPCSSTGRGSKKRFASTLPTVLIVSVKGLVHTTVWPEHASITENILQTTVASFKITGIIHVSMTLILISLLSLCETTIRLRLL